MPRVEMATLCRGAVYNNGLLSITDGWLEIFAKPAYPAVTDFVAVMFMRAESDDLDERDDLQVSVVRDKDGLVVATGSCAWIWATTDDPDFLPHFAAMVHLGVKFPSPGSYTVKLETSRGLREARLVFAKQEP